MSINTQYSFEPPQPDNPTDSDRALLIHAALEQKGWPEDAGLIRELLSPPPPITEIAAPGEFSGVRVGVIGGGLAGLSAAFELRKLGFDITLFDAQEDRIGGRIYTYYFNRQKTLYHELGAMRIPVAHETVWHYLNLFHLPTRPFIQYNPNGFVYLKKVRVRNDRDGRNVMQYVAPKYLLAGWERFTSWQRMLSLGTDSQLLPASPQERAEILQVKPAYSQKTLQWSDLASIFTMQAAGLSQEAINLVLNFNPLLGGNLYESFIDFIQEEYPANTTYLYEIPGGLSRLPQEFFRSLTNPAPNSGKVAILQGYWVDGISLEGEKVKLNYRRTQGGQRAEELFDYVVCAIPFSTLRGLEIDPLFSNGKMRAIRELYYTPAQKTLLLCRERFWEKQGIVGGSSYTDLPIASLWYPSDHAKYLDAADGVARDFRELPTSEPGVMIGSYDFSLDTTRLTSQPQEGISADVRRQVEAVHGLRPGALDAIVKEVQTMNWERQPTFRGALSFFAPGQKELFSWVMAQPEYGSRVFFAGEHISAVHRWIQGALQTGMQAANDLAAACKAREQGGKSK